MNMKKYLLGYALLGLSACSGSFLNARQNRKVPLAPRGPISGDPRGSAPNSASAQIMSFLPDSPNTGLESRGGVLSILFGKNIIDPFEANNSAGSVVVDFRVRSEGTNEETFENFVHAKVTFRLMNGNKVVASRDFESEGTLNLKNIDTQDVMTGTFLDLDSSKIRLAIAARRIASGNDAEARSNKWSGTLSLIEDDHRETSLGKIEGFFSGILSP